MDWKDIAGTVAKSAPMLGGLLGGPIGAGVGAIGSLIASALGVGNTPDEVSQALAVNPDAAVKLKEIESRRQVDLQALVIQAEATRLAAETASLAAVNATMQAEAKAEHWPTYTWRPFCGFVAGSMIFGCYFVLPLLKLPVPAVPESAWLMLTAILGVASFFRGKAQVADAAAKG